MHAYTGMPWEAPFRAVEELLSGWDGRPHWGKLSFLGAADLAPRYPGWAAWQAARAELDPAAVFTKRWAERVLGPVRAPAAAAGEASK